MKHICIVLLLVISTPVFAQQYGAPVTKDQAIEAAKITKLQANHTESIKVIGTVKEVCQVKGCWMTMDMGNQLSMRITFKDYGFFVPPESSGKTAVLEGQLKTETIDIATLQHFAKDAGKSDEEIAAISEPKVEFVFVASGVLLL
jgi:hypothetical protein